MQYRDKEGWEKEESRKAEIKRRGRFDRWQRAVGGCACVSALSTVALFSALQQERTCPKWPLLLGGKFPPWASEVSDSSLRQEARRVGRKSRKSIWFLALVDSGLILTSGKGKKRHTI